MLAMEPGAVVVVNCQGPKEKIWGVLLRLDAVGAVVRGLDLNTVPDWLHQELHGDVKLIAPSTVFVPMHRVERIYLDETTGSSETFAERYAAASGGDVREALGWPEP